MTSPFPQQDLGGGGAPPASSKHAFSVIMVQPESTLPRFLYNIQQGDLKPIFVGEDAVVFRRPQPIRPGWSHIFIVGGEVPESHLMSTTPQASISQSWTFSINSDQDFIMDDGPQAGRSRLGDQSATQPEDLVACTRYWTRPRDTRFLALAFLKFPKRADAAVKRYRDVIAGASDDFAPMLHLMGKVTADHRSATANYITQDEDGIKGVANDDGDAHDFTHFALLSFDSEKAFGDFLVSDAYRAMMAGRKSAERGFVFTRELRLPPKSQPIDVYSWKWGSPYEPHGMDFFG